jgi:hypothetical protein
MAGGAESPRLAGERQQMFTAAIRAADPGEAGTRVAAVEIALDDLLDDRPELAVLLLETALVRCQEPVEVMEQHPIEDRTLRMARTVDSRHIGRVDPKSVPEIPPENKKGRRPLPGHPPFGVRIKSARR